MRATLNVPEVAELLGVSAETIYRQVRAGEMRAVRIGRRLVVPVVDVEQLLGAPVTAPAAPPLEDLTTISTGVHGRRPIESPDPGTVPPAAVPGSASNDRGACALDVVLAVCAVLCAVLAAPTGVPGVGVLATWERIALTVTSVACALAVTWLPRRPHHGGADGSAGATPRSEVSGASTPDGATADPTP